MRLEVLTPEVLRHLYHTELKRAFPPSELKSLQAIEKLLSQDRYDPLGLYDGEELLGYALMWLEPGVPFALLDYLGTVEGRRGQGLGGQCLDLLAQRYSHFRGVFGESEAPDAGDPAGEGLRRRRLAFYERNGFRYGGYDCALFGVHYRTLIRGQANVTPQELLQAHQAIYRAGMPQAVYDRFIQIPLQPGEALKPLTDWK